MPHALNRLAALERTGVALPTGDGGVGVLGSTECSQARRVKAEIRENIVR